jgi:ATP-dependent helicase/nuclease subunit A
MSSPTFELTNAVMRAGAGAGKTTELTTRVLELAKSYRRTHDRNPHFVVTTFTRKATQELKERLLKKALAEKEFPWLVDFVKSSSQLHISTIHGILSLYLSRFGSIMNLSPQVKMISSHRAQLQVKKLIRKFSEQDENFSLKFQSLLESAEFSDIMTAFETYFSLKLQFGEIEAFAKEDFLKVMAQHRARLGTAVQSLSSELQGNKVPKAWSELGQYLSAFDPKAWSTDFIENMPSTRKGKDTPEIWLELRETIQEEGKFLSQWNCLPDYFQEHSVMAANFKICAEKICEALLEEKLDSGEISMSDLETLSLKLVREHPETAEAFAKNWNYWLIDEYQDTSPAQVELLKCLMGEAPSFVVGDPQQSIYLFRGARSEVFIQREKSCQEMGGDLLSRRINYRSSPEVLEFFNHVFLNLGSQFQAMQPNPNVAMNLENSAADILIVPTPEKGSDEDPELSAILFRIQELTQQGVAPEAIAVLSRNNLDLERLAWQAKDFGIPVQVHSAGKFFERREIVDALSVLKFLCNPYDNKNLIQLLRSPGFFINDQILADWCVDAGKFYWKRFSKETHPVVPVLKAALQEKESIGIGQVWMNLLIDRGLFNFAQFTDPSGRREANLWKLVQMIRLEERRPGFSFLNFLKDLEVQASTEESDQGDAIPVVSPSRVNLMTVHASKGLEFDHVLLARVGDTPPSPKTEFFHADESTGRWSLSPINTETGAKQASLSTQNLLGILKDRLKEEDERVFYVAMTRAKRGVTLVLKENLGKNSWVPRLNLNLSPGLQKEKNFCYSVRADSFLPVKSEGKEASVLSASEPFKIDQNEVFKILSVTDILDQGQSTDSAMIKKKTLQAEDIQKALTGVQVHRLLENLKYHWLRNPKFDWQKDLALSTAETKALSYVLTDQEGLWKNLIKGGSVEFGFSVFQKNNLIQGQIDLWGIQSDVAWVVDYKTGNPKYQDKAFEQLKIYAWALKQMGQISATTEIKLAVIYPFSQKTKVESFPSTYAPSL